MDQTQGLKLDNNAQLMTIPGIDLAALPAAKRAEALQKLNAASCTCGCDLTVAKCRVDDPACGVSLPLAREIVKQIAGTVTEIAELADSEQIDLRFDLQSAPDFGYRPDWDRSALAAHLVQLRRDGGVARRTDAVAELRVGVLRDVSLDLLPVLIVAADALAVAADRQQPVQLLDVDQRRLQLGDALRQLLLQRRARGGRPRPARAAPRGRTA